MAFADNVRINTTLEGYKLILAYCDEHPTKMALIDSEHEPAILDISEKLDSVVFGWDDVKWNPCYDEVSVIENALEMLDEHEPHIPWEFIRVGEEFDDVEESHGRPDVYMEHRNIELGILTTTYDDSKPLENRFSVQYI